MLALLCLTLPVSASDLQSTISAFTNELHSLPKTLGDSLSANLVREHSGLSASLVSGSGNVYSLVVLPRRGDSEHDISAELEIAAQNRALMQASTRLAFFVGQGGVDRKLFRYDDALGTALLTYYQAEITGHRMSGIQTASDVVDGYVLGLAWLDSRTAGTLSDAIPERGTLDDDYCRFLYRNHAERLFREGKYTEALPVFRNIHEFRWSDVDAYLDASECFLRSGQPEECVKLLRELRAELDGRMSSLHLQRMGRLYREAGDKSSAAEALRSARKRLHEEQRKGNQ